MSNTIFDVSQQIKAKLSNLYPSTEIESFIFMIYQHVLDLSSAQTLAYPEKEVALENLTAIFQIIQRLEKVEPIQYILGYTEFYDCKLRVKPGVLIPRPETEELVYWILNDNPDGKLQVIDIGTGSGAIPIALSSNRREWEMHAIDVSEAALNIAIENAETNEVKIKFHKLDVLQGQLPGNDCFDIVISNPPYVTHKEKQLMQNNVLEYEPHLALFVEDDDPLLFYRRIAELAMDRLNKKGQLFFEINEQFGQETCELLKHIGFEHVVLKKDLDGKDRMIKAIKPF